MKPPAEKAKELVLQFYEVVKNKYPSTSAMTLAKQCALILVDEILTLDLYQSEQMYYQEVKNQI